MANRLDKNQFYKAIGGEGNWNSSRDSVTSKKAAVKYFILANLLGLETWFDIDNLEMHALIRLVAQHKKDLMQYNKYMPAKMLSKEGRRRLVDVANKLGAFDKFENFLKYTEYLDIEKASVKDVQHLQKLIAVKLGAK